MTGFVKIYSTILDSSVWGESKDTRLLWVTMLAMTNQHGVVEASVGGLARRAGLTREECETALAVLEAPDVDDRSGVDEGRRIRKTEGGWFITNHKHYRDFRSDKQVNDAKRQQKKRSRERQDDGVTSRSVTPSHAQSRPVAAEADPEAKTDQKAKHEITRAREPATVEGEPDLRHRSEAWLLDRQRACLEYPNPQAWPEAQRLVAVLADVFGGPPQPIRSSGDPRMKALLTLWAEGRTTDELEQALRGAGKDDHLLRNPQLQTLTTILRDSNQVDRFTRLLTIAPIVQARPANNGNRAGDLLGAQLARADALQELESGVTIAALAAVPQRKALQ